MDDLDTRFCDCDTHGKQKAYIVCNHILDKRDRKLIAHHLPWTEKGGAGELLCAAGQHDDVDNLSLMCEAHLLEIGLLLKGEERLT